ncbi:MAG: hypothetical protein KDD47_27160, partial [Acidobacteria bacterium]|nr:hypothetical protein [Acidobacteriota bacterium]
VEHAHSWARLGGGFVFSVRRLDSPSFTLWHSDGTAGGTHLLLEFQDAPLFFETSTEVLGAQVLFRVARAGGQEDLWTTDGTAAGTRLLRSIPATEGFQTIFQAAFDLQGEALLFARREELETFTVTDCELWRSDGTTNGTAPFARLQERAGAGDEPNFFGCPFGAALLDGHVFFRYSSAAAGEELWSTDGTAAGTGLFADLEPGTGGSFPRQLAGFQGRLWFTASRGHQVHLYQSDGTVAGTRAVETLEGAAEFAPFEGRVMVSARGPAGQAGLWLTDGSEEGTSMAFEPPPTPASSAVGSILRLRDRILFSARSSATGSEPWVSDGTAEGTAVLDLFPGTNSSFLLERHVFDDHAYFYDGSRIWRSDGTERGTRILVDQVALGRAIPMDGFVYVDRDADEGRELWRTDGTPSGTSLVKDIFPGTLPDPEDPGSGEEFANSSNPDLRDRLGGRIVFWARDAAHGVELWATDGTGAGTELLADLTPGPESSPHWDREARVGEQLFFVVLNRLGVTDGTPSGTRLLTEPVTDRIRDFTSLAALRGRIFALVSEHTLEERLPTHSLWTSDGTLEGTFEVQSFPGTFEPQGDLVTAGSRLFLSAWSPEVGTELWSGDGTAGGFSLARDIQPGIRGSNPLHLRAVDGVLLFTASTPETGRELWRSDGTERGTRPVGEIEPGPGSSVPGGFTPLGDQVLFSAYQTETGRELWAVNRQEIRTACSPAPDRLCLADGRYEVVVDWHNQRTGARGTGASAPFSGDTGFFSFFREANVEL